VFFPTLAAVQHAVFKNILTHKRRISIHDRVKSNFSSTNPIKP
jgi:hypothetical protein